MSGRLLSWKSELAELAGQAPGALLLGSVLGDEILRQDDGTRVLERGLGGQLEVVSWLQRLGGASKVARAGSKVTTTT